jgi:hypothetical protein
MSKSNTYKYRYELQQTGTSRVELFGRDTAMSHDQLELYRRELNEQGQNSYHISRIWLVNQKTGRVLARTSQSTPPKLPLFTVEVA